jgi:hypothetical protein
MTPLTEHKLRERIRELLTTGALDRQPWRMPTRALSPAPAPAGSPPAPAEPCYICLEAGADVAYFDLVQRAETYVHSEPCGMLWLNEARR